MSRNDMTRNEMYFFFDKHMEKMAQILELLEKINIHLSQIDVELTRANERGKP
jgi:predicted house-cleaning noncanonical NTP pyrophosphatase (MazG superfamily)